MLRATLKALFRDPETVLTQLGIAPTARAETLCVEQICQLALHLDRSK